ncbi:hypothetical protein DXB97_11745 [Firmicutes bacterium OM07-11]|nr:hypothetical protein DXB97_11745 [Firmicutes bacterium OM07-11]
MPFEKGESFSQRIFSIYTDIRKLQDKSKTSYTLSTRRLRFDYEQQFNRSTCISFIGTPGKRLAKVISLSFTSTKL